MNPRNQHRLRKHPDYQRVYKTSRKQWAGMIAYFSTGRVPGSQAALRSETAGPRVGLTVPKALGKAVDRNRIKRRLRALVRPALPLLGGLPVDVVLHPKRGVLQAEFIFLEREIALIFKTIRKRQANAASETPAPASPRGSSIPRPVPAPTNPDAAR